MRNDLYISRNAHHAQPTKKQPRVDLGKLLKPHLRPPDRLEKSAPPKTKPLTAAELRVVQEALKIAASVRKADALRKAAPAALPAPVAVAAPAAPPLPEPLPALGSHGGAITRDVLERLEFERHAGLIKAVHQGGGMDPVPSWARRAR